MAIERNTARAQQWGISTQSPERIPGILTIFAKISLDTNTQMPRIQRR